MSKRPRNKAAKLIKSVSCTVYNPMKAKKSFGQHFLRNTHLTANMARDIVGHNAQNRILEVGPGKGILTKDLLGIAECFKAVELDRDMIEYLLEEEILDHQQLIQEDFLRLNLEEVYKGESFTLVGNYPYNISSQIVLKMLHNHLLIPYAMGMFQLEMARRITGSMNTKDYGSLSILTQLFYDSKIIYKVKPGDFAPPPKVHSAVVRFVRKDSLPDLSIGILEKYLRRAFAHRRKKIKNNLHTETEVEILNEMGLADLRAEQIPMDVFVELIRNIS